MQVAPQRCMHHYPWRGRFQGEGCNPDGGGAGAAAACSALDALHGRGRGGKPPSDLVPQGAFGNAQCVGNCSLECNNALLSVTASHARRPQHSKLFISLCYELREFNWPKYVCLLRPNR